MSAVNLLLMDGTKYRIIDQLIVEDYLTRLLCSFNGKSIF